MGTALQPGKEIVGRHVKYQTQRLNDPDCRILINTVKESREILMADGMRFNLARDSRSNIS